MGTVTGVAPGFLLLPARAYNWELKTKIEIRLPVEGKISELLEDDLLAQNLRINLNDDFLIVEDGFTYLWQIVGVLFAQSKYPALEDNEAVNIVALQKDGNELVLYGEVIKSLP